MGNETMEMGLSPEALEALKGAFEGAFTKQATALGGEVAKLSDVVIDKIKASYRVDDGPAKPADVTKPKAELADGFIPSNITNLRVWEIPVGKIAIGTFGGVFVNEIVDGFMARQSDMTKGLVKLGAAGAVVVWGRRFIGSEAAAVIALVLGVFGLSQVLPIDKWASAAAGGVSRFLPGTIRVSGMDKTRTADNSQKIAMNYYPSVAGRVG